MARKLHMLLRAVFLSSLALTAFAQPGYLIRVTPNLITQVTNNYGFTNVKQLSGNLYSVTAPSNANFNTLLSALNNDSNVKWVEPDQTITLPPKWDRSTNPAAGNFNATQDWANLLSPFAWSGYLYQPAASVINIAGAHKYATGAGIVAFLDTGVDFNNRVLMFSLMPGADFTTQSGGPGQESGSLNQSTTSILDDDSMYQLNQSTTSILDYSGNSNCDACVNQSTTSILDQSTTSILDNGTPVPNAYGHGTMVAGLIHLVAPTARLMPVKVFGNDGTAQLSTILAGFYYAINHGADIVNMSFSMSAPSTELQNALNTATSMGVVCVAAVGNGGAQVPLYPAAYSQVIGVGSTNNQDVRSSFSNYGQTVDVAAPGEEVISTYPGNTYAAGWGTSFSTPLVTGAVALLQQLNPFLTAQQANSAIAKGSDALPGQQLGAGELDLVKLLNH